MMGRCSFDQWEGRMVLLQLPDSVMSGRVFIGKFISAKLKTQLVRWGPNV